MQKFVRRKFVDSKCYTKKEDVGSESRDRARICCRMRTQIHCSDRYATTTPASQGMQRLPSFLRSIPRSGAVLRGSSTKEDDVYDRGGRFFRGWSSKPTAKYIAEKPRMRGFNSHGTRRSPFLRSFPRSGVFQNSEV